MHIVRSRIARRLSPLLACAAVILGVACSESYDGGQACPSLCPVTPSAFRDTIVEAVTLDTTIGGFPTLGLSAALLVANRPDTLVTNGVLRFDVLPTAFRPNNGTDTASITAIDSVYLRLPLDSTGRSGTTPVTLDVFDVDTTASDSVSAVVRSLFTTARRIGTLTFVPSTSPDSIRVPLSKAAVLAKIRGSARLRLGLRITSGTGQVRVRAFELGGGSPTVAFDASTDTLYAPTIVSTSTSIGGLTSDASLAYQVYTLLDRGSPTPGTNTLVVGGFPAYRSYLRFVIPPRILDSSTIVRAELLLTQRPSTFASAGDSVSVVPLVPTSVASVTDLRRVLDLSAQGTFAQLDSTRLVPRDSGQRAVNVITLVRSWYSLPTNVPRAIAFRIGNEGAQASEFRFFSSEAAPALRPRLRLTYLPRTEAALP
jgi:hypothetical protein